MTEIKITDIKVTDEAVEAGARAYYENLGWDWASLDTEAREHDQSKAIILAEFRRALEAAAPLLQVQAIDRAAMIEAIESASYRTEDIRGEAYVENYAHAFADVALALLSPEETK